MDISVDCQSNANFSQQLSLAHLFNLSSYLGCAVSVQNSSGAILGCGRFESLFPVTAIYRGKIALSQSTPYLPVLYRLNYLEIFQYKVLQGINGTCSSESAIFDPWSPLPMQIDRMNSSKRLLPDQLPVGDLMNHGLRGLFLFEVPLIGSATILGHVVCSEHDSKFCVHLKLNSCLQYE